MFDFRNKHQKCTVVKLFISFYKGSMNPPYLFCTNLANSEGEIRADFPTPKRVMTVYQKVSPIKFGNKKYTN